MTESPILSPKLEGTLYTFTAMHVLDLSTQQNVLEIIETVTYTFFQQVTSAVSYFWNIFDNVKSLKQKIYARPPTETQYMYIYYGMESDEEFEQITLQNTILFVFVPFTSASNGTRSNFTVCWFAPV